MYFIKQLMKLFFFNEFIVNLTIIIDAKYYLFY